MHSPVGCNAQYCASVFGASLDRVAEINKKAAWSLLYDIHFHNNNKSIGGGAGWRSWDVLVSTVQTPNPRFDKWVSHNGGTSKI